MRAIVPALRARPAPTLGYAATLAFAVISASAAFAAAVSLIASAPNVEAHDAIDDSFSEVASLALHNAAVALIPFALLCLHWDRARAARLLGDVFVATSLIGNGAIIGNALARAGLDLAAYLPHLPFEWSALALPAGTWLHFSRSDPNRRRGPLLRPLALSAVALGVAALLEVYAVPLG